MSDTLYREIAKLREQLEEKDRMILSLRSTLLPEIEWPPEWRLSPVQTKILTQLYLNRSTYPKLEFALYGSMGKEHVSDPRNIITTTICVLRKRIPKQIEILTRWGVGYELTQSSREYLQEVLDNR